MGWCFGWFGSGLWFSRVVCWVSVVLEFLFEVVERVGESFRGGFLFLGLG